jgi:hypothetical protein
MRETTRDNNNYSQVSHPCTPRGLFIGLVIGGYYNVRNALIHLP